MTVAGKHFIKETMTVCHLVTEQYCICNIECNCLLLLSRAAAKISWNHQYVNSTRGLQLIQIFFYKLPKFMQLHKNGEVSSCHPGLCAAHSSLCQTVQSITLSFSHYSPWTNVNSHLHDAQLEHRESNAI